MNKKTIILPLTGIVAGFFSAAFGIGGGVIIMPALIFLFKTDIKKAIGPSLAAIVPCALVGVLSHYAINSGNLKWLSALLILPGSIAGAKLGAVIASKIKSRALSRLFSILLLFAGLKYIKIIHLPVIEAFDGVSYPLLVFLGLIAGSGSALFGIGGGIIMVPGLNLFFGLSIHEAVATSLIVIFPTTIAGALFHKQLDNLDMEAVKFLVPTSLVAAFFGALFANSLPAENLKIAFGAFLVLCAIRLFVKK